MHEALRYLPYLLIKIADSIKNAGTTIHIGVPANIAIVLYGCFLPFTATLELQSFIGQFNLLVGSHFP